MVHASRSDRLPVATRLLHWGSALLLIAAFALGLLLEGWPRGAPRDQAMMVHYSLGVLVLGLVMVRLLRRLLLPPPPAEGAVLERLAATAMHWTLYAAMIALPVSGVLDRWARGRRLALFGDNVVPAPFPIGGGRIWREAHEMIAWLLLALVAAHVLAALWHHFALRDNVLRRMLPSAPALPARIGAIPSPHAEA